MGAILQQKALPAGRYRVGGEMRPYSRERLKQYADNTNKAIESGLSIPFLDKHADVDADPDSSLRTKGWVKRFSVTDDGWLGYEVDVTDPATKQAIENKSVRFTSPEFRDGFVDGKGLLMGDIIRHVATTPTPRNPDQGEIMALPAGVARFSMDDFAPDDDEKKKKGDTDGDGEVEGSGEETPPTETKNPDLPPDPDETSKMEAFVACMSQLGLELPAGFTFDTEGAIDILLTAAKTAAKANAEKEVSKEQDNPPDVNDAQGGMTQFSEQEIAALPAAAQKRIKALQQQAVQFAEEKAKHNREKAVAAVNAANLPPGLKTKLVSRLETVRFGESGEVATLTVAEVAKLVSESLPPSVKFDEADVKDVAHPEGEAHFKGSTKVEKAEAKSIVDEWETELGYPKRT
jgi:hypothetical protein